MRADRADDQVLNSLYAKEHSVRLADEYDLRHGHSFSYRERPHRQCFLRAGFDAELARHCPRQRNQQ
jgi:hypothetical protein